MRRELLNASAPTAPAAPAPAREDARAGVGYLLDLTRGFWKSEILFTAAEAGVFTHLARGPRSAAELAAASGLHPDAAPDLLDALVALGLLEKEAGAYRNTATSALFLVEGRGTYIGGALTLLGRRGRHLWDGLGVFARNGRGPQNAAGDLFDRLKADDAERRAFFEGLHALAQFPASSLARTLDLAGARTLLDVGGGSGAYAIALAKRFPDLRVTLLDLPETVAFAEEKVRGAGLDGRIAFQGGDFFRDPFPAPIDAVLYSNVLHDWAPDPVRALLRKTFAALAPGGRVFVSDLVLDEDRAGPEAPALMNLTLRLDTLGGRNYSTAEFSTFLSETGFREVRVEPVMGATRCVAGARPRDGNPA